MEEKKTTNSRPVVASLLALMMTMTGASTIEQLVAGLEEFDHDSQPSETTVHVPEPDATDG